jgi:RNA polymerase sigma-70 factor, ECF subfamily
MGISSEDRDELERAVRSRIEGRDFTGAATVVIRGYGPEIFGFLSARLRDEALAREAFAMFSEDLWRGLPKFGERSTVRVWAYALARHAAIRLQSSPHRKRERNVPLSAREVLSKLTDRVRTDTAPFLRTEFKTRIAALRARLSEEDRTLLVLRVDRGLEWGEVARVFLAPEESVSERALLAEVVRLRKRFQLVKAKIRKMAKDEGFGADDT